MRTMMIDKYWYPALNVAGHFEVDFTSIPAPKKAGEMMAVAIAMAGMQELHKKPYWIQGVPDSEQSPDVRTIWCEDRNDGMAPLCYQQDVEVVSYTEHSTKETIANFVAKTKLAADTAYDNLTTILVHVTTNAKLPSERDWNSVLAPTGKRNPVMVLGRISPSKPEYRLAFVHPVVQGAIDYNANILLKRQGYTSVVRWSLGIKAGHTRDEEEKHCPFEKFGVNCRLI